RRRARATSQGGRARGGHAREHALRRERPGRGRRRGAREARPLPSGARSPRRLTVSAVEWLDGMSPWPRGGFGLDRMRALLVELGDPQLTYPAIHVVGTNGKSTASVAIEH